MQHRNSRVPFQVGIALFFLFHVPTLFGVVDACPPACRFEPVRIGIAYDGSQSAAMKAGKDRNFRYTKALQDGGAKVVLLRIDEESKLLETRLSEIDGLLLPGGDDVAPARYGEEPHPKLETVDEPFDAFEFRLLQAARDREIPVLGICRGHQILNVFLGGSLYQDIPSQVLPANAVKHRNRENGKNTFCEHPVVVATGSLFWSIVGSEPLTVNTFHHQGVKALGRDLRPGATTADGVIEAFEGTGSWYLLGVQFHPEKDASTAPRMRKIFTDFISAARDRRKPSALVPATIEDAPKGGRVK